MTDTDRRRKPPEALAVTGWVLRYEWGMWRSLFRWIVFRWILRRPLTSGRDEKAFPYAGTMTPLLLAFIGVSAIEIPIVDLLIPWPTVRMVAIVLGGYGLLWMVGMLASFRVSPHIVGEAGLRLRHGVTTDVTIPWDAIATVRIASRSTPKSRAIQYQESDHGRILNVVIMSQTNVDVVMRQRTTIPLFRGESETFTELRCYADDPDALVASASKHLTTQVPKQPSRTD